MKEQEARRKKQKEEEERKANVVAESNDAVSNGKLRAGTYLGEREDTKTEPLDADDLSSTGISSINGNSSPQVLKEYQDITTGMGEDNGKDDQHLYENVGKVKCYSICYGILFILYACFERCSFVLNPQTSHLICFGMFSSFPSHFLIHHISGTFRMVLPVYCPC